MQPCPGAKCRANKPACLPVQAEREAQARNALDVLNSLWQALSISEGATEQAAIRRLLSGPQMLHARTLDKVCGSLARTWSHAC